MFINNFKKYYYKFKKIHYFQFLKIILILQFKTKTILKNKIFYKNDINFKKIHIIFLNQLYNNFRKYLY